MIKRREFIAGLGSTAASSAAWPLAARAQRQPAMPVIGFLDGGPARPNAGFMVAFRQALAEAGYVEGQSVAIEYRWADSQFVRLPELAADLISRQVAVIVASGPPGPALAAKAATSTIPIVIAVAVDPVKYGLVASLNRPGANVTGVTALTHELAGKRFGLLRELVPQATTVAALLAGPNLTSEEQKSDMLAAGRALARQVIILEIRSDRDYEAAFETLVQRQAGALIVGPFPFRNTNEILALAARHRIPAIYPSRGFVVAGGLMSYSAVADTYRQAGIYAGRILKGEKPADLPVVQPTKFELVINLKTAKALELTIPEKLLAIADEVIE
jgi:putative ABC transport system substrate-binding protein